MMSASCCQTRRIPAAKPEARMTRRSIIVTAFNNTLPSSRRTGIVLIALLLMMLVVSTVVAGTQGASAAPQAQPIWQGEATLQTIIGHHSDVWFMEINTHFQIPRPAVARSTGNIWFMEINTFLPGYSLLVPPAPQGHDLTGVVGPY
jgi:hypothetical protein